MGVSHLDQAFCSHLFWLIGLAHINVRPLCYNCIFANLISFFAAHTVFVCNNWTIKACLLFCIALVFSLLFQHFKSHIDFNFNFLLYCYSESFIWIANRNKMYRRCTDNWFETMLYCIYFFWVHAVMYVSCIACIRADS